MIPRTFIGPLATRTAWNQVLQWPLTWYAYTIARDLKSTRIFLYVKGLFIFLNVLD